MTVEDGCNAPHAMILIKTSRMKLIATGVCVMGPTPGKKLPSGCITRQVILLPWIMMQFVPLVII
ncbi:MAG: hypothetical protein A2X80_04695 [Geobacteraceae bacterium GWB2_52_12]|nr:MAG: hypothetical protein A2X80_04695 [Geobacteraceae bacterium GWB2_52_12]